VAHRRGKIAIVEERLSRIEGGYEHLATKADVMATRTDIERLEVWLFAAIVGGNLATAGLILAVLRLWSD
jgi:hypothetical protein